MIDLRSDAVTKPTPEMYEAMCKAPLGDDVIGEGNHPTVHKLQDMAAERMGKEAALFVPSGMMANLLAVKLFASPGDRVVCQDRAHIYQMSVLAMAGANSVALRTDKYGAIDSDELRIALQPNPHFSPAVLLCLENAANFTGGTVLTPEYVARVSSIAHEKGAAVHLDGARIFNAAIALGVDVKEFTRHADIMMFCISKGLSSPVGSLLVGSRALIEPARGLRYLHGGAMRQSGVLAACGIVSLEKMVERLRDDHVNARLIAEALAQIDGVTLDLDVVQTNMVWFDIAGTGLSGEQFVAGLEEQDVKVIQQGPTMLRITTHKDVSRQDALTVIEIIKDMLNRSHALHRRRREGSALFMG